MTSQNKLNRVRIWIFSAVCAVLLSSSAEAVTIKAGPNPAAVGKPVTFLISIGGTNCDLDIYFGDGGPNIIVSPVPGSTYTCQHTYTQPGLYTVIVSAFNCGAGPAQPNPANTTVRVSDFSISRIELKFDNNQPKITVKRNEEIKELSAKISYTGSGFLKGYWEVDGQRRSTVFRHVLTGPFVTIRYPEIPPLPTFTPGTHRVRFVVTHPYLNVDFPQALYFVRTDPGMDRVPIRLVLPEKNQVCDYARTEFTWKKHEKSVLYNIRFYKADSSEVIFSAYSRNSEYFLREKPLNLRFYPGGFFSWQVFGLNSEDQICAKSDVRSFSFSQAAAFVPDQFLLAAEQNSDGDKLKNEIIRNFNAEIIETHPLKTIGLDLITFFVKQDIFEVMEEIRSRPGAVFVQPDFIYATLTEPLSDIQKISSLLSMDEEKIVQSGKDVSVGIIDTAVDIRHQDIEKAVIFHHDLIEKKKDISEIHGTAVAGLIAARINSFGIRGVAPDSRIIALRACRQISQDNPKGECYSHTLVQALDSAIQQKAGIVNLSLGMKGEDLLISKLIRAGAEHNILFVAPAGNREDDSGLMFPASHPDVISVGGLLPDSRPYPNDIIADLCDIKAPCQNILTTTPGNEHNFLSGTSLSSALVTGILALCREADPGFNLDDFRQMGGSLGSVFEFLSSHKQL